MLPNRISAEMTQEDIDEVMAAIDTIKKKLPFLVTLSKKEMKGLPKAGAKARDFSTKSLEVAKQNPDIMPRGFDIDEMGKDVELFNKFEPVYLALTKLMESVECTHTLIRIEAYVAALMVYTQVKLMGKTLGLEATTDLLGELFARKVKPALPSDNNK